MDTVTSTDHWLQPLVTDFNRSAIARAIILRAQITESTRTVLGKRILYRMCADYPALVDEPEEVIVETLNTQKYQQVTAAYEEMSKWPSVDLVRVAYISTRQAHRYVIRRQPGPRKWIAARPLAPVEQDELRELRRRFRNVGLPLNPKDRERFTRLLSRSARHWWSKLSTEEKHRRGRHAAQMRYHP